MMNWYCLQRSGWGFFLLGRKKYERERVNSVMHEKGEKEGVAFMFCAGIRGVVDFKVLSSVWMLYRHLGHSLFGVFFHLLLLLSNVTYAQGLVNFRN